MALAPTPAFALSLSAQLFLALIDMTKTIHMTGARRQLRGRQRFSRPTMRKMLASSEV
jgi:hypothetical protein